MDAPKLIDLFCGCGGMSLGAARAGFNIVAGIDRDERALRSHTLNFPTARHLALDLANVSAAAILSAAGLVAGQVDVVTGGPPCQGFSSMGKRDLADMRNLLLYDFFRLVRDLNPKAFVLENVPGLLDIRNADILADALSAVSSSYAVLKPHTVTASDVGAPTLRKRVFIVGFLSGQFAAGAKFWPALRPGDRAPIVRHALSGLPADITPNWKGAASGRRTVKVTRKGRFFTAATARVPVGVGDPAFLREYRKHRLVTGCWGTVHSSDLLKRYGALAAGQSDEKTKSVRLDPDGYCPTLRAGTGPERGSFQAVRPIHYLRPRVITPREAARLQGFPDWFQFDQTKWHSFRQIGNSVSPLVSEFVMSNVMRFLNAESRLG